MITAPAFVALFIACGALCRWRGDRAGARLGWVMAGGCVAAWVVVAVSAWWPLWLAVLWTMVAGFVLTLRPQTLAAAGVAISGELSALTYLLNYLSGIPPAQITAAANGFGLIAAAVIGGPHVGALISRGFVRPAGLGLGAHLPRVARRRAWGRPRDPGGGPKVAP